MTLVYHPCKNKLQMHRMLLNSLESFYLYIIIYKKYRKVYHSHFAENSKSLDTEHADKNTWFSATSFMFNLGKVMRLQMKTVVLLSKH